MVDGRGRGHVEDPPAGVAQALLEVGLVGVDEEVAGRGSRPPRRRRGARASRSTAPSRPRACSAPPLCTVTQPVEEAARRRARSRRSGSRHAHGCGSPSGVEQLRARRPPPARPHSAQSSSASTAPARSSESSLSSRQYSPRASRSSVVSFSALPGAPLVLDQPHVHRRAPAPPRPTRRRRRCRAPGPRARRPPGACRGSPRGSASRMLAPVRVDDAVGERDRQVRHNRRRCGSRSSIPRRSRRPTTTPSRRALARAGADVELVTSRFLYGPVPREDGYRVTEAFYRRTAERGLEAPARRAFKLAEHVPDMLRFRRRRRTADARALAVADRPARSTCRCCPRATARASPLHYPLPSSQRRPLAAQRMAAVALRRRRLALRARRGAAARRGRPRRRPRPRDPARRVRLPDAPARRARRSRPSSPRSRGR